MTVSVKFSAREIDDGYQLMSINPTYPNSAIENDKQYLKFELTTGKTQTSFTTEYVSFSKYEMFDFIVNRQLQLYIRFGAEGSGEDDWEIKDIEVTVTFS